jgi:hypothetical protein
LPPVVAPALPASDWPLEAQIGALRVELRAPAAERGDVYMVRLAAGLTLAPDETGALSLATEAEPRVDAELVEQADDQPVLTPDALEVLFATAVWPQLEQALAGGLAVTLPEIQVDAGAFAGFAPRLQSLTLRPDLARAGRRPGAGGRRGALTGSALFSARDVGPRSQSAALDQRLG